MTTIDCLLVALYFGFALFIVLFTIRIPSAYGWPRQ